MGDHYRRIDALFTDQTYDVAHIVDGAAAGAGNMVLLVVDIVEIKGGAEFLSRGPAKKFRQPSKAKMASPNSTGGDWEAYTNTSSKPPWEKAISSSLSVEVVNTSRIQEVAAASSGLKILWARSRRSD